MKKAQCLFVIIILLSIFPGLLEINGETNTGEAMLSKSDISNSMPETVLTPSPAKQVSVREQVYTPACPSNAAAPAKISNAGLLQEKSSKLQLSKDFGKIPLYFIPNEGQVNAKARFYAKTSNYTLWMTGDGLVFDKTRKMDSVGGVSTKGTSSGRVPRPSVTAESAAVDAGDGVHTVSGKHHRGSGRGAPSHMNISYERSVSRLMFIGANEDAEMTAGAVTDHRVNYFIGDDKSKWHSDIETSKSVTYKDIYKNIDLKVYGIEKQIEYDWIVHPGADPAKISFKYENVESVEIDKEGNLVVHTDFGDLVHCRAVSYQVIEGKRIDVKVDFRKMQEGSYGFEASEYDTRFKLVIDPLVLDYSTYLGGSSSDYGYGIAVDSSGSAYVTGFTHSTNFPLQNQYQTDQGSADAFVTKLSSAGNSLVYSTYLGGSSYDYGYGIAVDSSGSAYVTGNTYSTNFPLENQYQGYQGDRDVFVTKLSSAGNTLVYSTYLGGSGADYGDGIAVDSDQSAYVTGYTDSTNFPLQNQYQGYQGDKDVFVTKLSSAGNSLVYSTYLGGSDSDYGYGIAVDSDQSAYVTGYTGSTNFPLENQYQTEQGSSDAFVTKLSPAGNTLDYSTYLGGSSDDNSYGIAVDSSGSAYVTGYTQSSNFPLQNEYQGTYAGNNDVFVTKLSPTGNTLVYSTYLGGSNSDSGYGIAVDSSGSAYVTGVTFSTNFPLQNEYQGDQAVRDVFVTKLSPAGNSLAYSTYLGGSDVDYGYRIAVDSSGSAYVTGYTYSTNFPLQNEYQGDQGGRDAFVTKLRWQSPNTAPVAVINADRFGGVAPVMIYFDGSLSYDTDGTVVAWRWGFGDGATGTGEMITHEYAAPGTYNVILSVKDNYGDWSPTVSETVLVLESIESLSCALEVIPASFKANGRESGIMGAILYQLVSADGASGTPVLTDIGLVLTTSGGTPAGDKQFYKATGKLTETLGSGAPGTATITAAFDGTVLASADVTFTWPQPPLNLTVQIRENRGLFVGEYYVDLTWSLNTADIYTPAQYKIYRSQNNGDWELLDTVGAGTFSYTDPGVPAGSSYRYAVSTVDTAGDESEKVVAELNSGQ